MQANRVTVFAIGLALSFIAVDFASAGTASATEDAMPTDQDQQQNGFIMTGGSAFLVVTAVAHRNGTAAGAAYPTTSPQQAFVVTEAKQSTTKPNEFCLGWQPPTGGKFFLWVKDMGDGVTQKDSYAHIGSGPSTTCDHILSRDRRGTINPTPYDFRVVLF